MIVMDSIAPGTTASVSKILANLATLGSQQRELLSWGGGQHTVLPLLADTQNFKEVMVPLESIHTHLWSAVVLSRKHRKVLRVSFQVYNIRQEHDRITAKIGSAATVQRPSRAQNRCKDAPSWPGPLERRGPPGRPNYCRQSSGFSSGQRRLPATDGAVRCSLILF